MDHGLEIIRIGSSNIGTYYDAGFWFCQSGTAKIDQDKDGHEASKPKMDYCVGIFHKQILVNYKSQIIVRPAYSAPARLITMNSLSNQVNGYTSGQRQGNVHQGQLAYVQITFRDGSEHQYTTLKNKYEKRNDEEKYRRMIYNRGR